MYTPCGPFPPFFFLDARRHAAKKSDRLDKSPPVLSHLNHVTIMRYLDFYLNQILPSGLCLLCFLLILSLSKKKNGYIHTTYIKC
jgi:hypothetical protein